jgi:hypothetical protein
MSNHPHPVSRFSRLRKLWKPAVATGAGGTTLAIWFEEIIAFTADFIGVIVISLMAGLIYLFKTYVFKSAMPRSDDIKKK